MSGQKTRRRGRPPDEETIARVRRSREPNVARAFQQTAIAALADVRRKLQNNEPISIELLGIVRLCSEWHTDFLSVQMSGGDPSEREREGEPPKP